MTTSRIIFVENTDAGVMTKLSNEELCVMYQNGDRSALEALCKNNEGLVHRYASQAVKHYHMSIMEEEDLFIEGNMGLIKAADRFTPDKGTKFTTYACWWIKQAIYRSIMNEGYTLRLPVHVFEQVIQISRYRKELHTDSPREVQQAILKKTGKKVPLARIQELMMYADKYMNVSSANHLVSEEQSKSELIDFLPANDCVEDEVMDVMVKETLENVLSELTEKENRIIHMRFGLGGFTPMTLKDVAKEYGVTRERIRQIEENALKKLAAPGNLRRLEGLLSA